MGDLFIIANNPQLDKINFNFSENSEYPYFTRTEINNGLLGYVDYLDDNHLIKGNSLAVGMISMYFHYISHDFYAGQFTKTAFPKFDGFNEAIALYFIVLLSKFQKTYQSVLVRDFEQTFYNSIVSLPTTNCKVNFSYMESFIRELEDERIRVLNAYLKISGLDNTELTQAEVDAVQKLRKGEVQWKEFNVTDVFEVKNTRNIDSSSIIEDSGKTPYLCASAFNNGVSSYITYKEEMLDQGNCIFIGGKTFVVSYQEKDFFSNDSHNLALYCNIPRTKLNQLFLATCVSKSLGHKYTWGDSISKTKIKKDKILLPSTDGHIDFSMMETVIRAVQKLVIKDVVNYTNKNLRKGVFDK